MVQLVALLITAALVVGGLLEGGFIDADQDDPEGAAVEATTEAAAGAAAGGQDDKAKAGGGRKARAGKADGRKPTASSSPRVEVFCVTSQQLGEIQTGFFEELEQQTDAIPQELQAAQREFVEENRSLFDDVQEVAPPAIRADVGTRNAATLAQAGVGQAPSAKQQRAAEQRIEQFEKKNC